MLGSLMILLVMDMVLADLQAQAVALSMKHTTTSVIGQDMTPKVRPHQTIRTITLYTMQISHIKESIFLSSVVDSMKMTKTITTRMLKG